MEGSSLSLSYNLYVFIEGLYIDLSSYEIARRTISLKTSQQEDLTETKKEKDKVKKTSKINKKNTEAGLHFHFFNNIPIGMKYVTVFLFSVVLFIAATFIVYIKLSTAKNDVDSIVTNSDITSTLTEMTILIEQQHSAITSYAIVGNDQYIDDYNNYNEELGDIFTKLDDIFIGTDEEETYKAIKDNVFMMSYLFHDFLIPIAENNENVTSLLLEVDTHKGVLINLTSELINIFSSEQGSLITNVEQSMNRSVIFLISINIISILLGFATLLIISKLISNNLKQVVRATTKIAKGDLTLEPLPYKGKDEIALLSNAVNQLNENMRNIIEKVKDAATEVSSSSELLRTASQDVKMGSRQMVMTMDELATGAESQANSAAYLQEKMGQFVESVNHSQKEGEAVVLSSEQVLVLTNEGSKLMAESVAQMNAIDQMVSHSVEKVRGLDEKSAQISHLVDVVKDIADQTNLLALNAAIEAARAGEHGKGFAIVAEEVRKLAEKVADSVTEITHIVTSIESETDEVTTALNVGYDQVKLGTKQIEKTGESFKTIAYFMQSMVGSIDTVAARLKEIGENSQQMNVLITDIAAVSEEAAAGVEQSSASSQETASAMDEISTNAEQLAHLAEQLNKEIDVFKV